MQHIELLGGAACNIDNPAANEGPAIVDAHDHRAAILEIFDPDLGPKRKTAVGCREHSGIHPFPARCPGAQAVPGSLAALRGGRFIRLKTGHCTERRNGHPYRKNARFSEFHSFVSVCC